jgi:hypothetical protein
VADPSQRQRRFESTRDGNGDRDRRESGAKESVVSNELDPSGDSVRMDEAELMANLVVAAGESDEQLADVTIDDILGVVPQPARETTPVAATSAPPATLIP